MLVPRQAHPDLQPQIEQLRAASHNRRDDALYAQCIQLLERAATLHDDAGFVLVAKSFALVIDQRGHPDEGLRWLHEALERARQSRWFDDQAELMVLIARVHYARGDYRAALDLWTEALDVAQRADELVQWGWAKLGIGQICDALGSPALAVAVFDELLRAIESTRGARVDLQRLDKLRLFTHLNVGVNCLRLERLDEAREHYQTGLALARALDIEDEQGEAWMRLAEVAHRQGHNDEAAVALDQAEAICRATSFVWALAHVHLLRAQILGEAGSARAALVQVDAALAQARAAGARHIEARVLLAQSQWAEAAGELPLALQALRQAQALLSGLDRQPTARTLLDIEDLAGIRTSPDRRLLMLSSDPVLDEHDARPAEQRLCDEGRLALNVDRVVYWVMDGDRLRPLVASGGVLPVETIAAAQAPELIERLRGGETVLAHQARHHQDTWPLHDLYLLPHGVQALLASPVQVGGQTTGVFFFEQIGQPHHWSRDAVVLANQLVTIAGRSLAQRERRADQARIRSLNRELRDANQALEQRIELRTAELRAAIAELERARLQAESSARIKGEFLAHMSHEIRTPLNGVLGMAQVGLQRSDGAERARDTFASIVASGRHLMGIVNDILDFSKIDAGMVVVESVPLDLHQLLVQSTQMVAERARHKGIVLAMEAAPELPQWCQGDPLRIGQVLLNLLSNAIKFTEQGQVTLQAKLEDGQLQLTVRDTGIGIAPEQLQRVFQPFQQADNSTTRQFGGTGLGLTITQRLVELMGGSIEVRSEIAAGSSFVVALPWRPWQPGTGSIAAPTAQPAAAGDLSGCSVLVAEDNEVNQLVVEQMLSLAGVTVTIAVNGRDALERVRQQPGAFDAVLMDVQMPEMNGYEATRLLRAGWPELPVIGLTADAMAEDRQRCLEAGMVDFVPKPVVVERLLAALAQHALRRDSLVNRP